ncbi:MAG: putative secreted protein [Herbinix sp.]|jgi:hypothetical protein|nr:putative secreted protein [Herbinix sp.]
MHGNKSSSTKCIQSTLICIIFIIHFLLSLPIKQADAAMSDWLKPVSNSYQRTITINNDYITQEGKHNPAKDGIVRYRTIGYRLTRERYNLYQKFTSGSNAMIDFSNMNGRVGGSYIDEDGMKVTTYTIAMDSFVTAAAEIGVTGKYIKDHGPVSIYMHNIFESYLNDSKRKGPLWGMQEFLAAEYWSETTQEIIQSYYNYEFKLNAVYNVQVLYVDESKKSLAGAVNESGVTISNTVYTLPVICGEQFNYSLPNTDDNLTLNHMNYKYDHYTYEYTKRTSSTLQKISENPDTLVSFKAPDAKLESTLTVYMYFKLEELNYKANVIAVDTSGKKLAELQDYQEVSAGTNYNYTFDTRRNTILYNQKSYTYQNKFYLSYTDSKGNIKKEPISPKTGPNIVNFPMPIAKEGSLASFCMIYNIGPTPSVTPPITMPPTPTPTAGPTPTPEIPPIEVPEYDYVSIPFTEVITTGRIRADIRGSERFVAELGIPTTESIFGEVIAKEYLLGYAFEKKVGIEYYDVTVKRDYTLKWMSATPDSAGGGKPVTETVTVEESFTVPRGYGYWIIDHLEYYKIDHAELRNYALPNGSITITPNTSYYSPPSISVNHNSNLEYHILPPEEVTRGIILDPVTIESTAEDPTRKPDIPMENFLIEANYYAQTYTGKAKVRNDSLIFHGRTVISSMITETEPPYIDMSAIPQCYNNISNNVLYKANMIIEATKKNGTYPSSGTIVYTALAQISSAKQDKPVFNISSLNPVVIHTPVVCVPSINADNDKYVQLIKPTDNCTQLVLDPDPFLSDFTVSISNTGFHSGKQGYNTRDFSKSLRNPNTSYIASSGGTLTNQIQFPFDVYIDVGGDKNRTNDNYIKAGTWISIGRSAPRFYLPMWTKEDVYTVNFRTVAVNGIPYLERTQVYANTDINKYIATDTLNVEVSGRIYGLTVYDLSDYPRWEEVFRVPESMNFKKDNPAYPNGTGLSNYGNGYSYTYALGTNDQYGNDTGRNMKYTFPLVNGSHPKNKNQGLLKTGYMVRYSLETTGSLFSDACMVSIKPSFYFIDKDGKNRKAVDLYYTEEINGKSKHLVKVGSALDQINLKSVRTGDLYLGIPENELKLTAVLRNQSLSQFAAQFSPMFYFSQIRLNWAFRTFTNQNYTNTIKSYASYTDVRNSGVTERFISMSKQKWYGQYYIPNDVHVVARGFDVMDYADKYGVDYKDEFWLKDGYIIVNFAIETVDENGQRRLSYINADNHLNRGHCSMWSLEGPPLQKTDNQNVTFNFYAGDFILYYSNKSMTEDYKAGAIY